MIYFLALLPATVLVIGGYVVMFVSNRSDGPMRMFGRYLSFWAFTLAGLVVLGAIFAAASGPHRMMMRDGRGGPGFMMWGGPGFDERGFMMRRFDRRAPPPPGAAEAPREPGPGDNAVPAPAPAATPAPSPATP